MATLTVWRKPPNLPEDVLCRGDLDEEGMIDFTEMTAPFTLPDDMPLDTLTGFLANASQSGFAFRVDVDGETVWPEPGVPEA